LNSEKLKDFSSEAPQSSQAYFCLTGSNNLSNNHHGKLSSENKLTLNLNSINCFDINEEEEEKKKEKEEISNEINTNYNLRIDESLNNQEPCLNGINANFEENNNNNINKINNNSNRNSSFKFEDDSKIKENFSNIEYADADRDIDEYNVDTAEAPNKISLILNKRKILKLQNSFKLQELNNRKFSQFSSESQLDHILNLLEENSAASKSNKNKDNISS